MGMGLARAQRVAQVLSNALNRQWALPAGAGFRRRFLSPPHRFCFSGFRGFKVLHRVRQAHLNTPDSADCGKAQ